MTKPSFLRAATVAGLLGLTLGASQSAWAVASIVLSTSNPLVYHQGSGTHTLQVDFSVKLDSRDTAADVLTYFGPMVAYDPSVLKFSGISFGSSMSVTGLPGENYSNTLLSPNDLPPVSYVDPLGGTYTLKTPPATPNIAGYDLGTGPVAPTVGHPYYDGSFYASVNVGGGFDATDADELLTTQQAGATIYSIVFDVITDNIATSSIVLIDDQYYVEFTNPTDALFDYKRGVGKTVFFPASNTLEVRVPVPTPLALMAAGLIGMGARRWRLGRS